MCSSVEALKEITTLVEKTTTEIQYIFDAMPGVIEEKCTGMWDHLPRGCSRNSSSTDVTSSIKTVSSSGVNMSASTNSAASKASTVILKEEAKIYRSVDKKQVLATYWIEAEEPIGDDEMREIEKSLLG